MKYSRASVTRVRAGEMDTAEALRILDAADASQGIGEFGWWISLPRECQSDPKIQSAIKSIAVKAGREPVMIYRR